MVDSIISRRYLSHISYHYLVPLIDSRSNLEFIQSDSQLNGLGAYDRIRIIDSLI